MEEDLGFAAAKLAGVVLLLGGIVLMHADATGLRMRGAGFFRAVVRRSLPQLLLLEGALASFLFVLADTPVLDLLGPAASACLFVIVLPALGGIAVRTSAEDIRGLRGAERLYVLVAGAVWGVFPFLLLFMLLTTALLLPLGESFPWEVVFSSLCCALLAGCLWIELRRRKEPQAPPGDAPHSGEPAARGGP